MHRAIGYISKRFVQVRPGEGKKTLLAFLYFFLIITAYYVIKPVSRSLILGNLGSRLVPYVDLVCAIAMGPVVALFARLVDKLSKPKLVSYSFWTVIGILLVFWKLLSLPASWISGAFYVWVAIFSVLVVTLFWLVANDLFRPRQAKRLFGFIGSGGILGGIVGSSIAAFGARVLGTERLILLSVALLVVSWWLVNELWKLQPEHPPAAEADFSGKPAKDNFLSDPSGFLRLLFQSRYLLLLVALVGLAKVVTTLIYYQFNPFIEQSFPDADSRTAFTGAFFGALNIVAFVIQFGFTSWVLRRVGLRTALCALPVGLFIGTTGLLLWPSLLVAAVTELYDGSMNYSLQQTTKEVLYLPINRSIRYKVKPFIDMVVFRFGKGFAAIIGIVCLHVLHMKPQFLGLLSLVLLAIWGFVAVWLSREYVVTIRTTLQARVVAFRMNARAKTQRGSAVPGGEADLGIGGELVGPLMDLASSSRKLELLDQLVKTHEAPPVHVRDFIAELNTQEVFNGFHADFGLDPARLKSVISDQSLAMAMRRQAVRMLARRVDQDTVDYLFGMLLVEEDSVLRQESVLGLIKLRLRKPHLEFPVKSIRRQVTHEIENYQRIVSVASIYRKHHHEPLSSDDPALALLRTLLQESVEQVFRLLMLLYRPEDIHLVYEQLQAHDAYLRADAIELLDNLVDPSMRTVLLPILDEDKFLSLLEEDLPVAHEPAKAYRVLQEAIWDHNYWLSITTLCAVGRLRLSSMHQELERASRHSAPLIATAAKTALYLATRP